MLPFVVHAEWLSFQIYNKLIFNFDNVKPSIYFKKNSCKYIIWLIRMSVIIGSKRYQSIDPTVFQDFLLCAEQILSMV